ncbi:MAG TPA: RDD family protein [Mycobacterium sp.]|nr:RDD family protein [Mycobacterium sp.]
MLQEAHTEAVTEQVEDCALALWASRAGAFAIDVLFGLAVIAALALLELSATPYGGLWWCSIVAAALVILAILVNRLLAPGVTTWTLGRALFGIAVLRPDGTRPGPWRLLVRDLAHLLDTLAVFVGWLWPLWDSRNRTFADLLLRTEVRRVDPPRIDMRRVVGTVLAAGVVVAAAATGLTYWTVYRHEQAVDSARSEIADQGPRIVEQILTYNAGTLKDDFAHAQSLVTANYRDQLVKEQQVVAKKAAASNEYWAVTSSVLPGVTADKATMLVFLQGQRQAQQQDVKFITATARVSFEKSDGKWRVSDLSVLTQPVMPKASP